VHVHLDEACRHHAIIAFLGAGLRQGPSRAACVAALGAARAVATQQARGEPLGDWLTSEIRVRGIRENAAALAVMEVPEYRHQVAQAYALEHRDRCRVLNDVLAILT
jgi:hypothetical protein